MIQRTVSSIQPLEVGASIRRVLPAAGPWLGRSAISLVYCWFGVLKVAGVSPAAALVNELQAVTLPFLDPQGFLVALGLFEMSVALLLLCGPRCRRVGFLLLGLHMATTFLPLLLLPSITWRGFGVLSLEGQYIVKNVVIVTLALVVRES
jgi:uncharacterized membrane protein YkgB